MSDQAGSVVLRVIKTWWNINVAISKAAIRGIIWLLTLQWLLG